jgi:hypothetical protein
MFSMNCLTILVSMRRHIGAATRDSVVSLSVDVNIMNALYLKIQLALQLENLKLTTESLLPDLNSQQLQD